MNTTPPPPAQDTRTVQRPLFPAWAMAAASLAAAFLFIEFVKRGGGGTPLLPSPFFAAVHSTLGIFYAQQGKNDESCAQFSRSIEMDNPNAEAHNNLGNILLQQGKWDEAVAEFRRALKLRPEYAEAQNNLGLAMLQQGHFDEAVGHFLASLDLRPGYADAENNLGYAILQKGRYQDAEPHFRSSIRHNSSSSQAHHNLALCLYAQGKVKESLERYQTAIDTNPKQVSSINNLAWILATTPDAALRDGARSLQLAQHVLALSAPDPIVQHTLAAAYAELGRFPEAAATAKAALALTTAQHHTGLVETIREQVRLYEAATHYREELPAEK